MNCQQLSREHFGLAIVTLLNNSHIFETDTTSKSDRVILSMKEHHFEKQDEGIGSNLKLLTHVH